MQQAGTAMSVDRADRKRVAAVATTLAKVSGRGETVAEVAHDARNMVTALGLYCDLLEEPGVLANPFAHYGYELRLVAAASRRLVEKLAAIDANLDTNREESHKPKGGDRVAHRSAEAEPNERTMVWDPKPSMPIASLAIELLANHNLLAALAGKGITLTIDVDGGARPVWMTAEDLTRVLVNLVKNASEAMPSGGRIEIELHELPARAGTTDALQVTVDDNGPGIAADSLEAIFEAGYSTRSKGAAAAGSWAARHRGLGLAISRSIIEAAGGRILASNRPQGGGRFEIELPVRKTGRP
jgi:signal transduction histidine kinase